MMAWTIAFLTGALGIAALAMVAQGQRSNEESPFVCNISALTADERAEHRRLGARMLASIHGTRELPDGYAFDLDGSRLSIAELATWTDFERRCCPFFDVALEWRRENGPLTLRLTGREGVKEFIRLEFPQKFR